MYFFNYTNINIWFGKNYFKGNKYKKIYVSNFKILFRNII